MGPSLQRAVPELTEGRRNVLRLGHVPVLARRAPHLGEQKVPLEEVEWAAGILSRPGRGAAAAGPRRLGGESAAREALGEAQRAFAEAFEASIPCGREGEEGTGRQSGLGWWLELYHFALAGLHLGREAALDMPVGELMALSAAHSWSMGATFRGPAYEERDLLEELEGEASGEEAGAAGPGAEEA